MFFPIQVIEKKRLILNTIAEKITYTEETNSLTVRLRPVFEHLRQIKLQKKLEFSASLETLSGTLETRSEGAKQALQNNTLDLSKITPIGTRKAPLNTKIGPCNEDSKKFNVVKVTILEPFDKEILANLSKKCNIYHKLILLIKLDTQTYYNIKMTLRFTSLSQIFVLTYSSSLAIARLHSYVKFAEPQNWVSSPTSSLIKKFGHKVQFFFICR